MARPKQNPENSSMEQTILRSAEKLFLDKGFAQTSTTEIAQKAGCNQALVHYYFRTKEQLFERIFSEKVQTFIRKFLNIYRPGTAFEEVIAGIVDAHYELLMKNPQLPTLILSELATNPGRIRKLKQTLAPEASALLESLDRDLQAEIAAGRVRPMSLQSLLLDLLSLNALPFVAQPVLKQVLGLSQTEYRQMLILRREEVKKTLLTSLRP